MERVKEKEGKNNSTHKKREIVEFNWKGTRSLKLKNDERREKSDNVNDSNENMSKKCREREREYSVCVSARVSVFFACVNKL